MKRLVKSAAKAKTSNHKPVAMLTGEAIRQELWLMMSKIQAGNIAPDKANSLARQAGEIARTAKVELQIVNACAAKPSKQLRTFAGI